MILINKETIKALVRDGEATVVLDEGDKRERKVRILVENESPFDCMLAACMGLRDSEWADERARDQARQRAANEDNGCELCGQPGFGCLGHTNAEYEAHHERVENNLAEAEEITRKG